MTWPERRWPAPILEHTAPKTLRCRALVWDFYVSRLSTCIYNGILSLLQYSEMFPSHRTTSALSPLQGPRKRSPALLYSTFSHHRKSLLLSPPCASPTHVLCSAPCPVPELTVAGGSLMDKSCVSVNSLLSTIAHICWTCPNITVVRLEPGERHEDIWDFVLKNICRGAACSECSWIRIAGPAGSGHPSWGRQAMRWPWVPSLGLKTQPRQVPRALCNLSAPKSKCHTMP